MFIKKHTTNNRTYFSIAESFRDEDGRPRQRILKYVGPDKAEAEAELSRLNMVTTVVTNSDVVTKNVVTKPDPVVTNVVTKIPSCDHTSLKQLGISFCKTCGTTF